MMLVVEIAIKSVIVIAAAALVNAVRYRRMSAATRHLVWTMAAGGVLLLPILAIALPSWQVAIPVASRQIAGTPAAAPPQAAGVLPLAAAPGAGATAGAVPWEMLPIALYLVGLCVCLARLIANRRIVQRAAHHATELTDPEWNRLLLSCSRLMNVTHRVRLVRSREYTVPMAFGTRRPTILIPAVADTWDEHRRAAVLLHELAHIARHDCLIQLLVSTACALYWVHPGVWWVARRLRVERELACDDLVLNTGTGPRDYAGHLLELAFLSSGGRAPALAVAMARPGKLEGRLLAILDPQRHRAAMPLRNRLAWIGTAASVLVAIAATTLAAVPADNQIRDSSPTASPQVQSSGDAVPPTLARELAAEGLKDLSDADVMRARDHGITGRYISALRAAGYSGLKLEDLIAARVHGVSAEYVRELAALGHAGLSLEDIISARRHGVSPEFVSAVQILGYRLTLDELMRARNHGVSPEYIGELRSLDYRNLSLEELIDARNHGVSPGYVRALRDLGYALPLDDLIKARSNGLTPEYLGKLQTVGYSGRNIDEIIRLKNRGTHFDRVRNRIAFYVRVHVDALVNTYLEWIR
jgi:beta-lactamase regulating signal transducer with metallopeptidase domain